MVSSHLTRNGELVLVFGKIGGVHFVLEAFISSAFFHLGRRELDRNRSTRKRARQEPSKRAGETRHPGTSKKLLVGRVRDSIELDRSRRKQFAGTYR